jgi:hypothetical protein
MKNSIQELKEVDLKNVVGGSFSETIESGLEAMFCGLVGIGVAVLIKRFYP